jgi:hypothetical protein
VRFYIIGNGPFAIMDNDQRRSICSYIVHRWEAELLMEALAERYVNASGAAE